MVYSPGPSWVSASDWESTGIVPEVEVVAPWDTFTFESDPAVRAALGLLGHDNGGPIASTSLPPAVNPGQAAATTPSPLSTAVSGTPAATGQVTFLCPDNLCTFTVPASWEHSHDESYANTVVDSFQPPDEAAIIESVVYDDGTEMSGEVAREFALGMLKDFDDVQDLVVTEEQSQPDGSQRLSWYSDAGGFSGESFYEVRGTTFLILTFAVNNPNYDRYQEVWSDLLASYTVP